MSAPLPSALLELISELLPVEPSSNSPLHLLHRIRGPICLLRRWNAHIGAEARRAVTSGSEEWINLAQSDKKKLKRIANPQKEKEFDEKGVALFLILGLWHIQHYIVTHPRSHSYSVRLVDYWFPSPPLPPFLFVQDPSLLDPTTVQLTKSKFAKFRATALAKVKGVKRFADAFEGSSQSLIEALQEELKSPTSSVVHFDHRLQWETESAGLLSWSKKAIEFWEFVNELFPLAEEPSDLEVVPDTLEGVQYEPQEFTKPTIESSKTVHQELMSVAEEKKAHISPSSTTLAPEPTSLPEDTTLVPDHPPSLPSHPAVVAASVYPSLPHTPKKISAYTHLGSETLSPPSLPISLPPASALSIPSSGALLENDHPIHSSQDVVFDSQPSTLSCSISQPPPPVPADQQVIDVDDTSDAELVNALARPLDPLPISRSSSPVAIKPFPPSPPSRAALSPPKPDPPVIKSSARRKSGRPRLSFKPDFDLSFVPPEPVPIHRRKIEKVAEEVDQPINVDGVRGQGGRDAVKPKGKGETGLGGTIELLTSSPVVKERMCDDSQLVADSQEVRIVPTGFPEVGPTSSPGPSSSPDQSSSSLPDPSPTPSSHKLQSSIEETPKPAAPILPPSSKHSPIPFPRLSPDTIPKHRTLVPCSNPVMFPDWLGGGSTGSDSGEEEDQDRAGMNHRAVRYKPGHLTTAGMVGLGIRNKRKLSKFLEEDGEVEEDELEADEEGGVNGWKRRKLDHHEGEETTGLPSTITGSSSTAIVSSMLAITSSLITPTAAFVLDRRSSSSNGSGSLSAVSSLVIGNASQSPEKEDSDRSVYEIFSSLEGEEKNGERKYRDETLPDSQVPSLGEVVKDSQETNSSLGYVDLPPGAVPISN